MITKKQLYKKLKEKKLFSKYCSTIASAFYKEQLPRAEKDDYETGWLSGRWTDLKSIETWWTDNLIIIQP